MSTEVDCMCLERRNLRGWGGDTKKGEKKAKEENSQIGVLHYRFLGL